MATYKVLQDIEAEDKLLGPLTLKQFIFATIAIGIGFVEFKLLTASGLGALRGLLVFLFFFPFAVFGFLAAPISRDQPNDIWLLARLRYLIKPRKRIWNQDGISQLVSITVPKKLEQILSNNLSQSEVSSRLQALASTLDSRGWAIKNVNVNLYAQPAYLDANDGTDRLVAPSALPVVTPVSDVGAADDILDVSNNATAQHLDQMMNASVQSHRKQAMQTIKAAPTTPTPAPADYWFLNQPTNSQQAQVVAPGATTPTTSTPTVEEQALLAKIQADQAAQQSFNSNLKTIQPLGGQSPTPITKLDEPKTPTQQTNDKRQTASNPAILKLANNDDLNVATIARQAKRISESDDEVVVSLH